MKTTRLITHSKISRSIALAAACLTSAAVHAGSLVVVTNANDSGPGSLRHAIEDLKATHIMIPPSIQHIEIFDPLTYGEEEPLTILGSGQTIKTWDNINILQLTMGADLTASKLHFEGPGGWSIENRGDQGGDAGKGIFIDVRDDQEGVVRMVLTDVSVSGVANHGIHISDCSEEDDCGSGSGGAGDGSPASISVTLHNVSVDDAGNGKFDADGLRVDDRGEGGISFVAKNSSFTNVGADGVELDEGDDGDVLATISRTRFNHNGGYCDPDLFWVEELVLEGSFADDDALREAVDEELEALGILDTGCLEIDDSSYDDGANETTVEFELDLDDGIDIDEAGNGSLNALITDSEIKGNLDEGVDFDEEGDGDGNDTTGDVAVSVLNSVAVFNTDDGIKVSEEGDGDVLGSLYEVKSRMNGGKGAVFEEEDEGILDVTVDRTKTMKNDDSDDTGLEIAQDGNAVENAASSLTVRNSDIKDGIDASGVVENY
jgi:hypothetical protein